MQGGPEPWESPGLSHAHRLTRDCRWPRWCGEGTPSHGTADCDPAHGWVPTGPYFSCLPNWRAPAQTPEGTWWDTLNASSLRKQQKDGAWKYGLPPLSPSTVELFLHNSACIQWFQNICAVWLFYSNWHLPRFNQLRFVLILTLTLKGGKILYRTVLAEFNALFSRSPFACDTMTWCPMSRLEKLG